MRVDVLNKMQFFSLRICNVNIIAFHSNLLTCKAKHIYKFTIGNEFSSYLRSTSVR